MPKPVILDTNAVIHFVEALDISKFKIVAKTLNNNQCYIPIEVLVETVYVMELKFLIDRQSIAGKLKDFISIQDNLISEVNTITFALNLFASSKLDFVDCLLAGYARINSHNVLTFDNDLKKELAERTFISG